MSVEEGVERDAARVDLEVAAGGAFEEAAIAAVADQALVAAAQYLRDSVEDGLALGAFLLASV
jgi:hypothetical protein